LWLALAAAPAPAQPVTTSPRPEAVAVTVYRAPARNLGEKMNLGWLNGFALISETRTVAIPAGESALRFEGVAGGILPESAIVTGLPGSVIEKNQDAFLLSPASLLDTSLGRRVHIRRTSAATGAVTETEAVIRSGAAGAVVIETPDGIEALRCSGLRETPVYDGVPEGLTARPTLSVRVRSAAAATATVTLSYLATGFDWQADYVAELSRDGRRMDLFAWLTLASGDETSFVAAQTSAVAGRLNRQEAALRFPDRSPLTLRCWPQGTTTSDLRPMLPPPPGAPPPPPVGMDTIIVTGSRIPQPNLMAASPVTMIAQQEELGDLKLYRIPEPVTVAARSQKQVALLQRTGIPIEIVYRRRVTSAGPAAAVPVVTTRNRESDRLGLALPSGGVTFFERLGSRRVMVGQGRTRDLAIGEDVEVEVGDSFAVTTDLVRKAKVPGVGEDHVLTVANARSEAIRFEAELDIGSDRVAYSSAKLGTRDGRPLWTVRVPANGRATLRYRRAAPARLDVPTGGSAGR
jgi:hypothetical protein